MRHGNAISFLMQTEGVNFPIAVALLAGAQGRFLQ
jgi:DNA primase